MRPGVQAGAMARPSVCATRDDSEDQAGTRDLMRAPGSFEDRVG